SLWLLFILSISIFYNSFIRSSGAVLGCTIGTIIIMSVLKSVFGHKLTMLPNKISTHIGTFVMNKDLPSNLIGTSIMTGVLFILLIIGSILLFKKAEYV